jgi:hypothetical protein
MPTEGKIGQRRINVISLDKQRILVVLNCFKLLTRGVSRRIHFKHVQCQNRKHSVRQEPRISNMRVSCTVAVTTRTSNSRKYRISKTLPSSCQAAFLNECNILRIFMGNLNPEHILWITTKESEKHKHALPSPCSCNTQIDSVHTAAKLTLKTRVCEDTITVPVSAGRVWKQRGWLKVSHVWRKMG